MPSKRFFRLSENKREKFIEAALNEFGKKNYENASVNQIAKQTEIAKASVYQYFENKKDLYLYLVEYGNREKQHYINQILSPQTNDFFSFFHEMCFASLYFDLHKPLISQFLYNVSQERFAEGLGNLQELTIEQGSNFYKKLIQSEQDKGNIRTDIDIDIIAFLLVQINNNLLSFLSIKYKLSGNKIRSFPISDTELRKLIHHFTEIIFSGIKY